MAEQLPEPPYTGPQILGVPIADISEIAGVSKLLIRSIGGVTTADLGFGPDYYTAPTCTMYWTNYSAISINDAINNGSRVAIEIDDNYGYFYADGECGTAYALTGYYVVDDRKRPMYFFWDSETQSAQMLPPPPQYTTYYASYSDKDLETAINNGDLVSIDADNDIIASSIFYGGGFYGSEFAAVGYYVVTLPGDNLGYYYWNHWVNEFGLREWVLEILSPPASGPTLSSPLTLFERVYDNNIDDFVLTSIPSESTFDITAELISSRMLNPNFSNPGYADNLLLWADRGTWSGTGNITYTYKWYRDGVQTSLTEGPWPAYNSKTGQMEDQPNSATGFGTTDIGKTIKFEVTATDDNGSTVEYIQFSVADPILNTYLTNTGISDQATIDALKYLRRQMLKPRSNTYYGTGDRGVDWYMFESLLKDYYPIAGDTREKQKWSLKNPNYALQFEGNLVGYRPSSWEHDSAGMRSTDMNNANDNVVSEFTASYYATPNSASNGFVFGVYSNTDYTEPMGNYYPIVSLNGFTYNPAGIQPVTNSAGYTTGYYTASLTTYTPNFAQYTPYAWAKATYSYGSRGFSGLLVQDGTYRSAYNYNTKVYGKVFTSGSYFWEALNIDWPITGSNQLQVLDTRLTVGGGLPTNVQFLYAGQVPAYMEADPNYTLGTPNSLYQLKTIIETYNSMLGR